MTDIGKGGDFLERGFGIFGRAMKKIYNVAQETYVAEDDFWKIFNFLSEHDNLRNAYTTGLKNGVIKSMPSDPAFEINTTLTLWPSLLSKFVRPLTSKSLSGDNLGSPVIIE